VVPHDQVIRRFNPQARRIFLSDRQFALSDPQLLRPDPQLALSDRQLLRPDRQLLLLDLRRHLPVAWPTGDRWDPTGPVSRRIAIGGGIPGVLIARRIPVEARPLVMVRTLVPGRMRATVQIPAMVRILVEVQVPTTMPIPVASKGRGNIRM
jgi:hypothetical protein